MNFAGIDIGGANIKFAALDGRATQISFPIWQEKDRLALILKQLEHTFEKKTLLGVTMTAELADCFNNKQEGVEFIARAVADAFPDSQPLFYRTDGLMCELDIAIKDWSRVAASNWHAAAWWAFAATNEPSGFLVDIGSTTTDIIPVADGQPTTPGQNDFDRLTNDQLLYAGVGRTPICSLISEFHFDQRITSAAREVFATMADAFLWLGDTQADEANTQTADGRPATKSNAGRRLARMVCADMEELAPGQLDQIAEQAKQALASQVSRSLHKVVSSHHHLPLVFKTIGEGAWLADQIINSGLSDANNMADENYPKSKIVPFSSNPMTNQTLPALAVAKKREQVHLLGQSDS